MFIFLVFFGGLVGWFAGWLGEGRGIWNLEFGIWNLVSKKRIEVGGEGNLRTYIN